jgi:hypothetical protein
MRIEYQISEDDFVTAGKLAMRKRFKRAAVQIYLFPILGAVFFVAALITAIAKHNLSGMLPIMLWGALLLCIPLLWSYQFRRVYRKNPLLRDRRTVDLDDSHLRFKTESSDSRVPWQSYTRFFEDDKTFILFQQGNKFFITIPKHELSPSQITELRSIFASHLPGK